jgi:hypothetical protein
VAEQPRRVTVFAGPTLVRARHIDPTLQTDDLDLRGPAARHDIASAAVGPAGVIVLVDGLFHQSLAVGHVELRDAIAAGWQVWGLASMGAIRAREMSHLGLRGFGRVWEMFEARDRDVRDDEVMLLHAPAPDFRELSEPLVHLRGAVAAMVAEGQLDKAAGVGLIAELEAMYFGDRTLAWFADRVRRIAPDANPLADFDRHRVKSIDLIDFIRRRPWAPC